MCKEHHYLFKVCNYINGLVFLRTSWNFRPVWCKILP